MFQKNKFADYTSDAFKEYPERKHNRPGWRRVAAKIVTVPADQHDDKPKLARQQKFKLSKLLLNPFVIVLPIIGALWLGWNFYLHATRDLNVSADSLLSGGSFDSFGTDGIPPGWQLRKSGDVKIHASHPQGYVGGLALRLDISDYKQGDAELLTPSVPLVKGSDYLFKGFYKSDAPFDLLAQFTYADGSSKLFLVRTALQSNSNWTTVSDAFNSKAMQAQTVKFVYRFYGNGGTELDDTYLEMNDEVAIPAEVKSKENFYQNADFTAVHGGIPKSWLEIHIGNNRSKFGFIGDNTEDPYLHIEASDYTSGEAKWQQAPIEAKPLHNYSFGVRYRSSAPAAVVVEYVLSNGKRQFDDIAMLHPADEWTNITGDYQAPSDAETMFASVILRSNGSLDTAGYSLADITKPGPLAWQRPLVSLAFDDGDKSAYQNGEQTLRQYNMPATFYVNPATIDTPNFMESTQLMGLQKNGNEIASHGYNNVDLTTVNAKRLRSELAGSKSYLDRTFSQHTMDFASPFGAVDAQTLPVIKSLYSSQRGNEDGINTLQNFDPYNLRVLYVGNNTPLSSIQSEITQTLAENGWLILVYHQVGANSNSTNSDGPEANVSVDNFSSQIKAVDQSGITVKTISAALREIENQ